MRYFLKREILELKNSMSEILKMQQRTSAVEQQVKDRITEVENGNFEIT